MLREISLTKFDVCARACLVKVLGDYEIDVSIITAVDLRDSKALQMASGDYGMVVYNELNFGFVLNWNTFEDLQKKLNITEEDYENFLDEVTSDLSDSVLNILGLW